MSVTAKDSEQELKQAIDRYNEAWNAHDVEAIMSMHAPDMVFENHAAGEAASGEDVRAHVASIFETWPDIEFTTRRLYVREDLVVQEWTATATHANRMTRGDLVAGAGDAAAGAKVLRDLAARSEVNLHEVRQLLARVERTANR